MYLPALILDLILKMMKTKDLETAEYLLLNWHLYYTRAVFLVEKRVERLKKSKLMNVTGNSAFKT